MLFWVTTANYIDRSVFSNLAPELQSRIGWTAGQYWYMQIAFNAAYAVSLLIGGRLMDVLGLRWGFTLAVAFWGLASMSHALVSTVMGFFVVRILLGLGEGSNFPAAIKTVAEWFPKRERAFATGLFNSGSNVGGILVPILVASLLPVLSRTRVGTVLPFLSDTQFGSHFIGWRGAFLVTGVIDLTWILVWLRVYRPPQDHPKVSAEELAIIHSEPPEPQVRVPWRRLFGFRQTWAFAIGKGLTDCMWWFFLFSAPLFFADRFHFDAKARELPVACIYIFSSFGSIAGGWVAGYFIKIGWSVNKARKVTMLTAAVLVAPVFYAAMTNVAWTAVALFTLAASAHQAWSANLYSLVGDMFPRRVVASVTGLGGMAGSIGAMILFFYAGHIRDAAQARGEIGDYLPIFAAASVAYVVAWLAVQSLAPKLEPAAIDVKAAAA